MNRLALALLLTVAPVAAKAADGPFPSTYVAPRAQPVLYRHADILTGAGALLRDTDLYVADGKVAAIGKVLPARPGAREVDATGRWLTPGLIDVHSHLGVRFVPETEGIPDAFEVGPVTPDVWVEHSIWTQSPDFEANRNGGVTTVQVLPGSPNLFGGRSVVLKTVPAVTVQAMKFPGAPYGLKMACGENPKRVYGGRGMAPASRMGELALDRKAFSQAQAYKRAWDAWRSGGGKGEPPARDLGLETLAGVLVGDIGVHIHCYRSDDLAQMLDLAQEFGFRINAFHHATEAYKVAPLLKARGTCAAVWADWWGGSGWAKREAYDAIPENAAIVDKAGACTIIHSDSELDSQRLNQEAAQAMAAGRRAGIDIRPEYAIQWITLNAARAIGVDRTTGSLEVGKAADVVLWSRDPFSVYALADEVLIDGATVRDRAHPKALPDSDFMLGQDAAKGGSR